MSKFSFHGIQYGNYTFICKFFKDNNAEQRIYSFDGVLPASRHSELWQKCFMRKAGISNMTQSEESVTLMTFYRLPPHGNRSFTFVQYDD